MITTIRHPFFTDRQEDWHKWRTVFEGGTQFLEQFLQKFSDREGFDQFERRKTITPTPNFAKAAVIEIRNSIFQRLVDVTRKGGDPTYLRAVSGKGGGVDLKGASMNSFIGTKVLDELLVLARVGIMVDAPRLKAKTARDELDFRPYLYTYPAERILSWTFQPNNPNEFQSLLVQDIVEQIDGATGLPIDTRERTRFMFIGDDGFVHVQFFQLEIEEQIGPAGQPIQKAIEIQVDAKGNKTDQDLILDIKTIPFVLLEITNSLLADVSNHQIALLNLESSDIAFALLSNYPFYVEQVDHRAVSPHLKQSGMGDGTAADAGTTQTKEIRTGGTHGRTYPQGLDQPAFIHPSSEPIQASIQKQRNLKDDIRQLVNLALSNIKPKMASAESKAIDERGLEAGLSYIGLVLEEAERKIAKYWTLYTKEEIPTIIYPQRWNLKTDSDRRADAKELLELLNRVPSQKYQKAIAKQIIEIILAPKLSTQELDSIIEEIESAKSMLSKPETILNAVKEGILSLEDAEQLLFLPTGTSKRAKQEHAERLKRIANSQAGARGLGDLAVSPNQAAEDEKRTSLGNSNTNEDN